MRDSDVDRQMICALKKLFTVSLCKGDAKQQRVNLGGHSVGDVGLHGGDVLLRVVHGDKKVAGLHGGVRVPGVRFQVIVQLQPVEQRGRGGRAGRLHRRAVGQHRFLRGHIS